MSPLRGQGVVPPRWSAHHQPVAESTMTARVDVIERPTGPTGLDGPGPARIVAQGVPARVQQQESAGANQPTPGGQELTTRRYLVTLPAHLPIRLVPGTLGHQLIVTATARGTDDHLVGRRFDIVQVEYGSEVFERDVLCEENTTQNGGTGR